MTVATSVDSLLEKLKQEELYFPPSNWESLHSQSCQFPPPTLHHLRCSCLYAWKHELCISLDLVRLALNALQGVESSLISIQKLSYGLCSHQSLSLWHRLSSTDALGHIL
ncbi:unnamed protein product [Brassica rapa]|uniref:Gamma-tubulin complex component n=1 Tax=Brassica campestris TaxID=3711 RepID=A0A8D9DFB8_BRACM|nr:unnamed protein product [Brassica rapa]